MKIQIQEWKHDNKHLLSKNEYIDYKTENGNAWNKCHFISCIGKATGKCKTLLQSNSVKDID